jgi:hypothetical protein
MAQCETLENICSENVTAPATGVVLEIRVAARRQLQQFTVQLKLAP